VLSRCITASKPCHSAEVSSVLVALLSPQHIQMKLDALRASMSGTRTHAP